MKRVEWGRLARRVPGGPASSWLLTKRWLQLGWGRPRLEAWPSVWGLGGAGDADAL